MPRPTILSTITQGVRASITLDNINLSNDYSGAVGRRSASGGSIPLVGNKRATYELIYRTQPWVRATIDRISGGVGRLPWAAFIEPDEPKSRQRQRRGPLAELLVTPFERGEPTLLKQAIMKNLLIHENAVVVKHRPGVGRPPDELLASSFAYWEIEGRESSPEWYIFHGEISGRPQRFYFRPSEVMHFHTWGTGRGLAGDSRMEALRTTLMIEDASQRLIIAAYENGMRPVGAYSVDHEFKNKESAERTRAQLNAVYGGVDNAFKIMLLEGGAKWQDMTHNFVDAEVLEIRKLDREEIVAVWNAPQPTVGILDHATFSNVTEQHLMEYQDTYQPWTTLIEEVFTSQLIAEEPLMRGQYVEFNYKEVLRGDPIREIDTLVKATGRPFMSANEARATQNLPPIEGGDTLPEAYNAATPPAAAK